MTLEESNDFNFKANIFRETSNLDCRTSRKRLVTREVLSIFGVHLIKIVHVTHEDSCLDNFRHISTSFLENSFNVVEDQASLSSDTILTMKFTSGRIKRDLTRGKQHAISLDCLTVRSNSLRGLVSGNNNLS